MVGGRKDREEMSDLISRSEAIKLLRKNMSNDIQDQITTENNINLIESLPTAFDTEKVVEQLVSEKRYGSKYDSYYEENLYRGEMFENDVNNKTIDKAIDIVKKGGVE